MSENLRSGFKSDRDGSGRSGSFGPSGRQRNEQQHAQRGFQPLSSQRMRFFHPRKLFHHRYLRRPLSWIGTLLGILWALPLTVAGLLFALPVFAWRGHAQLVRGRTAALLVRGPFADAVLSRHPFGAMTAMALGHVIIAEHQGLSSRVLMHELAHVRQAERWGIVFPFAYLASSAWAGMRGRDAYWHNRFEIAARKAEKHC